MSNATMPKASQDNPAKNRRKTLRRVLLIAGPLFVALGCLYAWIFGGRYVGTENAYIKANLVEVAPQVSGPVTNIAVIENQPVKRGQLLLQIDPQPYQVALDKAKAELRQTRSDIETLKANYEEKQAQLTKARNDLAYFDREYQRQLTLSHRHLNSAAQVDTAQHDLDSAKQQVQALNFQLQSIRASLDGNPALPAEAYPDYKAASAKVEQAQLDLDHTRVLAPFDGVASQTPYDGAYASAGHPIISVVSSRHVWIEANFKETDLTWLQPGDSVSIDVDTYPGHHWKGIVQSIAQATGSEFSVLPAQNATGNWVKVVQRIPVRIRLQDTADQPVLRAGMSVNVDVDTGYHSRGHGPLASALAWIRDGAAPPVKAAEPAQ